ncbi:MAG: PAS domain S-box protein [Spirochaetaceae bacterium]|nr:PAS domain S-box protein [Spirochaetaceae bacterium]
MDSRTIAETAVIFGYLSSFLYLFSIGRRPSDIVPQRNEALLFWAAGFFLYASGALALVNQGRIDPWISVVAANALITLGHGFALVGLRCFRGFRIRAARYGAAWAVFVLVFALLTFRRPSVSARIVVISVTIAALHAECGFHCFRLRKRYDSPLPSFLGAVFAFLSVFYVVRTVITILQPPESVFLGLPINQLTFLLVIFSVATWSMGFMLLLGEELKVRLRESESRYRGIVESAVEGFFESSRDGRLLALNDSFARIFGYANAEELRSLVTDLAAQVYARPAERERILAGVAERGCVEGLELELRHRDGSSRWVSVNAFRGAGGPDGPALVGSAIDITGRKRMEEELRRAYAGKATLLSELQHRVKNGFSLMAGLVGLEAGRVEDGAAAEILRGIERRIQALATLYELLYQVADARHICLGEYLGDVAKALCDGFGGPLRGIRFETELEGFSVEVKQAIPLGLIVNELVTDALKYAFPGQRGGLIRLGVRRAAGEGVVELSDDGVGLPPGYEIGSTGGLGLVIADMLARQIGGGLELSSAGGTRCVVRFPLAPTGGAEEAFG